MAERNEAPPKGIPPAEYTGRKPVTASDRFITRLQGLIRGAEQNPKYKVSGEVVSPASIVHYELLSEIQRVQPTDKQPGDQRMADFFQTISDVWGIIAFDQLTMRITKENVADTLDISARCARINHIRIQSPFFRNKRQSLTPWLRPQKFPITKRDRRKSQYPQSFSGLIISRMSNTIHPPTP